MRFLRIDRFGTPLGDVEGVLEARRKRDVGGTDTLELTMTGPLEKDDRVVARDSKGRWCEWICTSPQGERKDNVPPYGTCVLQGSVRELSRKMHVEVRNRNASARSALEKCLQGTRWEVGTVDVANTASVSYYHENAYQALIDLCKAFECEYEASYVVSGNYVTRRIISLYDRRGSASVAHRFEYGRDLPGVVRTVADDDVVTRLYGYGKGTPAFDEAGDFTGGYHRRISFADINGGKEYVENSSLVNTWGMVGPNGTLVPAEGVVFFNDCEDPAELLTLTRKELERHSTPIVEYQCDVIALARAGEGFEGADIGDTIRVVDTSFPVPVRIEARVLKIDESLTDGIGGTKLTIGNATETYTQRATAALQTLRDLQGMYKAWNEAAGSFPTYLNQVLLGLNTTINDSSGWTYLVPGIGLVTYDVEVSDPAVGAEASMVTEMRGGALRFANSRDSSGNWEFRTVLVPGHVAADMITAGMITAGYIKDETGGFFIDLDNHEYSLPGSTTVGGKTISQNVTDSLTQQAVFNALTNNGTIQGLYMQGGQLYVNASYIATGQLLASLITAGKIQSNNGKVYFDLDNNEIACNKIVDPSGSGGTSVSAKVGWRYTTSSNQEGALSIENGSYGTYVTGGSSSTPGRVVNSQGVSVSNRYSAGLYVESTGRTALSAYSATGAPTGNYGSHYTPDTNFIVLDRNGNVAINASNTLTMVGWPTNLTGYPVNVVSMQASEFKSRVVETEDYGRRLLYCYEMAAPMFGDIGEGGTDDRGECVIEIDDMLFETAATGTQYQVFLQKEGEGDLWVDLKEPTYFVVRGTPNTRFSWEIKAKQAGYVNTRLEDADNNPDAVNTGEFEPGDLYEMYDAEILQEIEEIERLQDEAA